MARQLSHRLPRWLQPKRASIADEQPSKDKNAGVMHLGCQEFSISTVPESNAGQAVEQTEMALKQ
jgi:hypothetical protein